MRSSPPAGSTAAQAVTTVTCLLIAAILPSVAAAAPPVSLESLLHEMVEPAASARWPEPEYSCRQASSHDRAKVAPDKPGWFANNDHTQFIRTEERDGRQERVMLDAEGPGALVRFWLTAGGKKGGVLRIYLDNADAPALEFPAYDLLAGDLAIDAPLAQPHPGYAPDKGGNTLYLPIPYASHCKVTWEEKTEGQRYYPINYRTYAPGTAVRSLDRRQIEAARPLIAQTNALLATPPHAAEGPESSLAETVPAGDSRSLDLPAGPAAIRGLEMRLDAGDPAAIERALRCLVVRLAFDGTETVWCPAGDFFGSGAGLNELRSWYRRVDRDGTLSGRWVMPYAKTARLTLLNVGTTPVKAAVRVVTGPWEWDDRSMHFHTAWHHEAGMRSPPVRDWNFVTLAGRGVYVGDTLALVNSVATWYGEGDEKIWVDGESFPSHLGTGTEDYYGYSYAPRGIISGVMDADLLLDDDDNLTAAGYDQLALLERKGFFS
ncbi:MAG: glycoside hydrolase family 172 protein [Planctomycetota bacterium]